MPSVSSLLLALVVTAALGVAATRYLWNQRRRRDEAEAGIRALAGMRWREFSHFVLDAMRHRGYDVLGTNDELERGQQAEFLLRRGPQRCLLACKHGTAYRITAPAVVEFAGTMRFRGANAGLLVTPGHFDDAARRPAADANIELIDGESLWPEIAPLLPQTLRDELHAGAERRARRHVGLAWAGAVLVGIAIAILGGGAVEEPAPVAATPVQATTPTLPPASTSVADPDHTLAAPTAPGLGGDAAGEPGIGELASGEPDPATDAEDRAEIAKMISQLPGIERALWTTKSTLLVHLAQEDVDRVTEICAILERYDHLRTSRVQLQPPADSERPVRFRQCRSY